jgi:hypothetical protein
MSFLAGRKTPDASGGNIDKVGSFTVHQFTSSGNFIPQYDTFVDILVVGGGGGKGSTNMTNPTSQANGTGGGGGGGSVFSRKWQKVTAGYPYPVIVGSAGIDGVGTNNKGTPGGTSIFNQPNGGSIPSMTSVGGGTGGASVSWPGPFPLVFGDSVPNGSGGGSGTQWASYAVNPGGTGANIIGYGFPGGPGTASPNSGPFRGGGGGGAGGTVNTLNGPAELGGNGIPISFITTNPLDFAGVGGGGMCGQPAPLSGSGSGIANPQALNSPTNYGRGGTSGVGTAFNSGPGVVLIRYV